MNCHTGGLQYLNRAVVCLIAGLLLPCVASAQEKEKKCQFKLAQTLPVHFNGIRPTIEAGINGKPVRMLIDSGAFTTSLFQSAADRLELNLRHSPLSAYGLGGESKTYLARIKEARFGESIGKYIDFPVIQAYANGIGSDGVVGAEFLFQRSDMEMSLVDRYLKFYKSSNCESTLLSYWDQDAQMVAFRQGSQTEPSPEIDVVVNGKKMRAMIDTGAPSSMIDLHAAEALGFKPSNPGVVKAPGDMGGIGANRTEMWIAPFESIEIGDEMIKNPRILVLDHWSGVRKDVKAFGMNDWIRERPEMILGIDFLRAHRLLFSVDQKIMYFTYLGGAIFRTSVEDDVSWFEMAAARGDAEAQLTLGSFYLNGSGVKRDALKAFAYFSKAAEKGNNEARAELGRLYEFGDGVEKNIAKAVELYRSAAEAGNAWGQTNLARAYEHGDGLEKDPVKAAQWYRKAAEQDAAYAQGKIGIAYMIGRGVGKDEKLASEWLDKALMDGRSSTYYWNLGRDLFKAGLYARSGEAFQKSIDASPQYAYPAIWLYLAQMRSGKAEGASQKLEQNKARWKTEHAWPASIADFYLGKISADQFIALAHTKDQKLENEQTCEANFYGAARQLIENRPKEARPLLESAVKSCPKNFVEYDAAVADLERMEAK